MGGSFYDPLLPPGTVHIATSFNAIHWLDQLPAVPVPDFVGYRRPHPPRPGVAVSPEATAAFRRQAEQDLVRFLECRAWELVPGGKLLVASPGDTDQACVGDGFSDVLNDACLDLVAAGQMERWDASGRSVHNSRRGRVRTADRPRIERGTGIRPSAAQEEDADERLDVLEGMLSAFPDRQGQEVGRGVAFFIPRGRVHAQSDCSGRRSLSTA